MKYRKKPVVVEAVQWFKDGDHPAVRRIRASCPDLICEHCHATKEEHGFIDTVQGGHEVCPADWILNEPAAEGFYPCKPDAFEATYEKVDGET